MQISLKRIYVYDCPDALLLALQRLGQDFLLAGGEGAVCLEGDALSICAGFNIHKTAVRRQVPGAAFLKEAVIHLVRIAEDRMVAFCRLDKEHSAASLAQPREGLKGVLVRPEIVSNEPQDKR